MGTKRPRHNDSIPDPEPRRTPAHHPPKRRRPNDPATPPPTATKPASINQLKSKIRDLTRALEHSAHLPAGVRIEKERALAGHRHDAAQMRTDKRRGELVRKYHMVRFFERRKATRALKRLRRLDDDAAVSSPSERELHDATIDLHYTIYHPLTEKYRSLYPRRGDPPPPPPPSAGARTAVREKPPMWMVVERCAAEGTLEALREGKLTPPPLASEEEEKKPREGKHARRAGASARGVSHKEEEEEEKSDGGFFEE